MKYESGSRFRRALEERLRNRNIQSGISLVWLRKMVAFDRFLARLFTLHPDKWVVKGGLALQLRLGGKARTTDALRQFLNPILAGDVDKEWDPVIWQWKQESC